MPWSKEQLLITSDFTIHVDVVNNLDSLKLLYLLESFSFWQNITQPTHFQGPTLDPIITRHSNQIVKDTLQTDRFILDHAVLLCKPLRDKPAVTSSVVTYRKLKLVEMDSLKNELAASRLCVIYH